LDHRFLLGEGPVYDEERHMLRFLDINRKQMHFVDLEKGPSSLCTVETETLIGVTADIEGSRDFIATGKHGFAILDHSTGKVEFVGRVFDKDGPEKAHRCAPCLSKLLKLILKLCSFGAIRMRMNDGAVDCRGRLWSGSMNDTLIIDAKDIKPEGSLWRFDPDGSAHEMLVGGIQVPNGIGWNGKNDLMYFTDSWTKEIYAFDFDAETGSISSKRVFYKAPADEPGVPDGLVVDEEDCVWSAMFFGGKLLRISPAGEVLAEITFPCPLPTCPVFVGTDLFVTTASHREKTPTRYGGCLFRVDVGVRGQPVYKFRWDKKN
jgi:sugar lactone lactonase YvrE